MLNYLFITCPKCKGEETDEKCSLCEGLGEVERYSNYYRDWLRNNRDKDDDIYLSSREISAVMR